MISHRVHRVLRAVSAAAAVLVLGGCMTVRGTGPQPQDPADFSALPPVSVSPVPDGFDPRADAGAAVAAALAAARADRRPVLLEFGSATCADCRALSALSDAPAVHQILSRDYHLVTVDVSHDPGNTALAAHYLRSAAGGPAGGLPELVVLDPDGSPRPGTGGNRFADAGALTVDRFAGTLVDWLYR